MPVADARGVAVSHADNAALAAFERALLQYQSYRGDAVATIDAALAERPDFVLGHLFRAGVLLTFGERRVLADARASVAAVGALEGSVNARERGLLAALRAGVDGDMHLACARFDAVLTEWPRDAFALQTAHLLDFFRGDALNLRNRVSRVLPHWSAGVPGYAYILGMHAFGLEECNEYAAAEAAGRRALELERDDAWAVHAVAHVMEMQGRVDEGIDWLEQRVDDWSPGNTFAFHNWWHVALFYLDRDDTEAVLRLYDECVYAGTPDACFVMVDAAALLWRLALFGVDVADRAAVLADVWQQRIDAEVDFYAFNDFHAVLAMLLAGRRDAAGDIVAALAETARSSATNNRAMALDVALPLSRAACEFADGRYARAIELALPVRDIAHRFGGSHAQRDLITLTIVVAAIRAGQPRLANHLLAERAVHKPASPLGWRLHQRIGAA
jgi:tetratricopeptide (TPR) repeat protein